MDVGEAKTVSVVSLFNDAGGAHMYELKPDMTANSVLDPSQITPPALEEILAEGFAFTVIITETVSVSRGKTVYPSTVIEYIPGEVVVKLTESPVKLSRFVESLQPYKVIPLAFNQVVSPAQISEF